MVAAAIDIVASYAAMRQACASRRHIVHHRRRLQGAIWAREIILGVIAQPGRDTRRDPRSAMRWSIIRVLVSVALFAIAFIVILDNLGVNVTALVAGLGIGGIAIGLAAQGIFSDLFAALAIVFDRPFRRGDTIRYDTTTGTVERIGLKTTRMRSLTGEQVIMANTKLLEQEIHNLAEASSRRIACRSAVARNRPTIDRSPRSASEAVEASRAASWSAAAARWVRPQPLDYRTGL